MVVASKRRDDGTTSTIAKPSDHKSTATINELRAEPPPKEQPLQIIRSGLQRLNDFKSDYITRLYNQNRVSKGDYSNFSRFSTMEIQCFSSFKECIQSVIKNTKKLSQIVRIANPGQFNKTCNASSATYQVLLDSNNVIKFKRIRIITTAKSAIVATGKGGADGILVLVVDNNQATPPTELPLNEQPSLTLTNRKIASGRAVKTLAKVKVHDKSPPLARGHSTTHPIQIINDNLVFKASTINKNSQATLMSLNEQLSLTRTSREIVGERATVKTLTKHSTINPVQTINASTYENDNNFQSTLMSLNERPGLTVTNRDIVGEKAVKTFTKHSTINPVQTINASPYDNHNNFQSTLMSLNERPGLTVTNRDIVGERAVKTFTKHSTINPVQSINDNLVSKASTSNTTNSQVTLKSLKEQPSLTQTNREIVGERVPAKTLTKIKEVPPLTRCHSTINPIQTINENLVFKASTNINNNSQSTSLNEQPSLTEMNREIVGEGATVKTLTKIKEVKSPPLTRCTYPMRSTINLIPTVNEDLVFKAIASENHNNFQSTFIMSLNEQRSLTQTNQEIVGERAVKVLTNIKEVPGKSPQLIRGHVTNTQLMHSAVNPVQTTNNYNLVITPSPTNINFQATLMSLNEQPSLTMTNREIEGEKVTKIKEVPGKSPPLTRGSITQQMHSAVNAAQIMNYLVLKALTNNNSSQSTLMSLNEQPNREIVGERASVNTLTRIKEFPGKSPSLTRGHITNPHLMHSTMNPVQTIDGSTFEYENNSHQSTLMPQVTSANKKQVINKRSAKQEDECASAIINIDFNKETALGQVRNVKLDKKPAGKSLATRNPLLVQLLEPTNNSEGIEPKTEAVISPAAGDNVVNAAIAGEDLSLNAMTPLAENDLPGNGQIGQVLSISNDVTLLSDSEITELFSAPQQHNAFSSSTTAKKKLAPPKPKPAQKDTIKIKCMKVNKNYARRPKQANITGTDCPPFKPPAIYSPIKEHPLTFAAVANDDIENTGDVITKGSEDLLAENLQKAPEPPSAASETTTLPLEEDPTTTRTVDTSQYRLPIISNVQSLSHQELEPGYFFSPPPLPTLHGLPSRSELNKYFKCVAPAETTPATVEGVYPEQLLPAAFTTMPDDDDIGTIEQANSGRSEDVTKVVDSSNAIMPSAPSSTTARKKLEPPKLKHDQRYTIKRCMRINTDCARRPKRAKLTTDFPPFKTPAINPLVPLTFAAAAKDNDNNESRPILENIDIITKGREDVLAENHQKAPESPSSTTETTTLSLEGVDTPTRTVDIQYRLPIISNVQSLSHLELEQDSDVFSPPLPSRFELTASAEIIPATVEGVYPEQLPAASTTMPDDDNIGTLEQVNPNGSKDVSSKDPKEAIMLSAPEEGTQIKAETIQYRLPVISNVQSLSQIAPLPTTELTAFESNLFNSYDFPFLPLENDDANKAPNDFDLNERSKLVETLRKKLASEESAAKASPSEANELRSFRVESVEHELNDRNDGHITAENDCNKQASQEAVVNIDSEISRESTDADIVHDDDDNNSSSNIIDIDDVTNTKKAPETSLSTNQGNKSAECSEVITGPNLKELEDKLTFSFWLKDVPHAREVNEVEANPSGSERKKSTSSTLTCSEKSRELIARIINDFDSSNSTPNNLAGIDDGNDTTKSKETEMSMSTKEGAKETSTFRFWMKDFDGLKESVTTGNMSGATTKETATKPEIIINVRDDAKLANDNTSVTIEIPDECTGTEDVILMSKNKSSEFCDRQSTDSVEEVIIASSERMEDSPCAKLNRGDNISMDKILIVKLYDLKYLLTGMKRSNSPKVLDESEERASKRRRTTIESSFDDISSCSTYEGKMLRNSKKHDGNNGGLKKSCEESAAVQSLKEYNDVNKKKAEKAIVIVNEDGHSTSERTMDDKTVETASLAIEKSFESKNDRGKVVNKKEELSNIITRKRRRLFTKKKIKKAVKSISNLDDTKDCKNKEKVMQEKFGRPSVKKMAILVEQLKKRMH